MATSKTTSKTKVALEYLLMGGSDLIGGLVKVVAEGLVIVVEAGFLDSRGSVGEGLSLGG